jgi:hypothetical protein
MTFDVYQDRKHKDPIVAGGLGNGGSIAGGTLITSTDYYIGDPQNADAPFVVTFTQE